MSHAVTITRTVTTTNTNAIILNSGYLKTGPGVLKLLQLVYKTIQSNSLIAKCKQKHCYDCYVSGYWRCYNWHSIMELSKQLAVSSANTISRSDVCIIFYMHILLIAGMHFLIEHWWIDFENIIRKFAISLLVNRIRSKSN